ncbi:MAG: sialidase family protein [Actinomycetota bacterium]
MGRISIDDIGEWPGSTEGTAVEPMVAVDPNNPQHVLAVYHARAILAGGYAASRDGGKTWVSGGLPGFSAPTGGPFDATWDLAAAFGPDGSTYVTAGAGDRFPSDHAAIQIARSPDGGLTWLQPITIVEENTCVRLDKPWVAVDTFPTSSHFGRVYVAWTEFRTLQPIVAGGIVYSHIVMSHSDDRGATWSASVSVSDPANVIDFGAIPVVHPNGDVSVIGGVQTVDPGASSFDTAMLSHNSHDGGETFDLPVPIDMFLGISPEGLREAGYHTAAIDRTTGELFVAWPDARSRLGDANDIVVSRSTDGGATWSRPGVVTPGEAGRTYFLPSLASDDGYVHLSYLTRTEGSDLVDTRYVVSEDGGATFGGELVLATESDLKYSPRQGFCPSEPLPTLLFPESDCGFLGDYTGIAAARGHVYVTWPHASKPTGSETTPNQSIWGAAIDR